jgi:hypothetical protein
MKQTAKLGTLIPTAALLYATGLFYPIHAAYAFEHRPARVIDGRGLILDSRYDHGRHSRAGPPEELIQSWLRGVEQGCLDVFDGVCVDSLGRST